MIIETKDPLHLYLIAQKVSEIRGLDYTPNDFINVVIDKETDGYIKMFIDIDEGKKVNGFIVASIVTPIPGKDELFIDLAWIDPGNNGLGADLQKKVEGWARELKLSKISTMVTRGEQAYKKKYGFKRESIVLYKQIEPVNKEVPDGKPIQTEKGKH